MQVGPREREEERRECGVETEVVGVAEHVADDRPEGRARTQSTYRKSPAPTRIGHSNRPERPDSAHDSSTMTATRGSGATRPPGKIDATAMLMAV